MIFAPNLKWSNFDIRGAVEKAMGLKVEMDNAANAWLLSEMWFGKMDGVRNAVLVTIAEGVGTGVIANGQPIYGKNGMAGEFGHMVMDPGGTGVRLRSARLLGDVCFVECGAEVLCGANAGGGRKWGLRSCMRWPLREIKMQWQRSRNRPGISGEDCDW